MERLRILNLEDDPLDAELVRTTLEEGGVDCEVVLVQTREEFLAALEAESFDLVLSDYSLPGFDGAAALEILRETHSDLPFIFVSGTLGEESAIEAVKSGATDYVLKQRLGRLAPAVLRAVREARERTALRRAEEALEEIREEERRRIARELHDNVLQDMAYVLQELEIAVLYPEETSPEALQPLADAQRRAIGAVREAVHELHPQELRDRTLPEALEDLVFTNRRMAPQLRAGLIVKEGFSLNIPEDTGRELLRIVQEALTNVRHHADARRVTVTLAAGNGGIRIEVSDDGKGFVPQETARGGLGMTSMGERAAALGGKLKIQSRPGAGTRVTFTGPSPT